jgi:hypothetical protein
MEWKKLLDLLKLLKRWSGRPGSNRRRPAWEAGILPLNYSRIPCRFNDLQHRASSRGLLEDYCISKLSNWLTNGNRTDTGACAYVFNETSTE